MNVLGVILARADSAGLKNKHLLPLLGKQVIGYTFEHARAARSLSRVVVSSDCPDVLRLAAGAGFETIVRPAGLATAEASVQDVMLHALDQVESRPGFRADALVVLYGNVPVRPAGVIDRAIDMLRTTACDSVRSFSPVGKWHPAWMAQLAGDRVLPLQSGSIHRRQDLAELFLHDGAVVAVSRESMLRGKTHPEDPHAFFGADRRGFATGMGETVEVDHLRDLYWAEAVLRCQAQVGPTSLQQDPMRIAI
ncbi:MAG TPA: NTP transferase domain-containing protein [Tepidisphaeraceae bacterium]|nr:NTP transferase domain-containing protein [Tepidisphaeraceae bacterium]